MHAFDFDELSILYASMHFHVVEARNLLKLGMVKRMALAFTCQ